MAPCTIQIVKLMKVWSWSSLWVAVMLRVVCWTIITTWRPRIVRMSQPSWRGRPRFNVNSKSRRTSVLFLFLSFLQTPARRQLARRKITRNFADIRRRRDFIVVVQLKPKRNFLFLSVSLLFNVMKFSRPTHTHTQHTLIIFPGKHDFLHFVVDEKFRESKRH